MGLLRPRVQAGITVPDVASSSSPRILPCCRPSSNTTAAAPEPRRPPATCVYKGFWISASLVGPQRSPCLHVSESEWVSTFSHVYKGYLTSHFPCEKCSAHSSCLSSVGSLGFFFSIFRNASYLRAITPAHVPQSLPGFPPVSLLPTRWWHHAKTTSFSYSLFLNALAFESQRSLPTLSPSHCRGSREPPCGA